jgi:guanine deaminase
LLVASSTAARVVRLRFSAKQGKLVGEIFLIKMSADFMRRAIALALENVRSGRGGPFGALIVKDERVIANGTNRVTSTNDPTAHAEIVAIREACRALGDFQLTDCDLYTTCEPCPMCLGAIYWARPTSVFYAGVAADAADAGFDDAFIYEEIQKQPAARRIPMTQLLREEALKVFAEWKGKPDKVRY